MFCDFRSDNFRMPAILAIILPVLKSIFEALFNAFAGIFTTPDVVKVGKDPEPVLETLDPYSGANDIRIDVDCFDRLLKGK